VIRLTGLTDRLRPDSVIGFTGIRKLIGEYNNAGAEYRPKGQSEKVGVHDFKGELGRASPYGIYDLQDNLGWVSVGISADGAVRRREHPSLVELDGI
jgi:hypothetical protein